MAKKKTAASKAPAKKKDAAKKPAPAKKPAAKKPTKKAPAKKPAATKEPTVNQTVQAIAKSNDKEVAKAAKEAGVQEGIEAERKRRREADKRKDNNMGALATTSKAKVISLADRRAIFNQLRDKQKAELEPYRDLLPKKHRKFEVGEKDYSESEVKQAGEAALKKRNAEAKKKSKANAEAKVFRKMIVSSSAAAAALGLLRDRAGIFAKLPALVKDKDGNRHPANNDLIIGAIGYAISVKVAKSSMQKKAAISISIAAFNNAARIFGSNVESFDKSLAKVREKLGLGLAA